MTAEQERDLLLSVMEQITDMDSRDGLRMKAAASDAVLQILEARVDARIKEQLK